jgi:ribosomal-protein-alanine N-acetyltransferase
VSHEVIQSERLDLVWLSPELIEALLAGGRAEAEQIGGFVLPLDWPNEHDARFLAFRLKQAREDPTQSPWLVRAIVMREPERPMIGHIGFHGAPGRNARKAPDAVEVGYSVFPEHRHRGYATEAVRALLDWARAQGIDRFVASVGPGNEPSLAIVRQLGFREVGRHWDDEDGEELEFELSAARGPIA